MNHKVLKSFLAIVLILLSSLACRALSLNSGPSLEGTWRGNYQGFEIVFTFQSDGSMIGQFDDEIGLGTYEADYSTSPHLITMSYEVQDAPVFTIFEFIDDNTIRIENNNPGESRPTFFSDYILMRREE